MLTNSLSSGVLFVACLSFASGCGDGGGGEGVNGTGGSCAGAAGSTGGGAGSGGTAGSSGSSGAGASAGSDAGPEDAGGGDAQTDAPSTQHVFPDLLWEGVWLIGRREGTDRFSWVKFQKPVSQINFAYVMDSAAPGVVGFFECEGKGELLTVPTLSKAKVLSLPAPCESPVQLRFFDLGTPSDMPAGAELQAYIEYYGSDDVLVGWRFAESQCDAAFTSCTEVLP